MLPSDRYLTSEKLNEPQVLSASPKTFKRWLFGLSLSTYDYRTFEEIRDMFAKEPFAIGEISFSKEGEVIEVMVKDDSVRLPIGRLSDNARP